jgi:hypothetical protein
VRRYSSADPSPTPDPALAIPRYWVRPTQKLSNEGGVHRFLWDMRYQPVPGVQPQYPISAVYMNTPPAPTAPWALPGKYSVVLTAGGKSHSQPLILRMDPRVKATSRELEEQFKWSKKVYDEWLVLAAMNESAAQIRRQITELTSRIPEGELKKSVQVFGVKLLTLTTIPVPGQALTGPARPTIAGVTTRLRTLFNIIDGVDAAPTTQATSAVSEMLNDSATLRQSWADFTSQDLFKVNQALRAAGFPVIEIRK